MFVFCFGALRWSELSLMVFLLQWHHIAGSPSMHFWCTAGAVSHVAPFFGTKLAHNFFPLPGHLFSLNMQEGKIFSQFSSLSSQIRISYWAEKPDYFERNLEWMSGHKNHLTAEFFFPRRIQLHPDSCLICYWRGLN